MNNFQKFVAQQLTKQQMNDVRGGELYECQFTTSTGTYTQYVEAEDQASAKSKVENNGSVAVSNVHCTVSMFTGPAF